MRLPRPDRRLLREARSLLACVLAGLLLLPAAAIAGQACVQPGGGVGGSGSPQGGIGGTGVPASGGTGGTGDRAGGTGGTGSLAGGIGGTGEQADAGIVGTGIVGTITGFASVCIGELEVHFDAATPVSMNGQPSSLARLALGQVVAMEAGPGARGLTARSIAILNALEGPVTRADAARGVLEVMGQPVRIAAALDASRIAAGSAVRVSGLRDARGVVHATRVEPATDLREASAIGFVRRAGRAASIDGLEVAGVAQSASGELLVRGTWDGRRLQVREQRSDPSLPFVGRVRDVVIEGLVHRRSAQVLQISGFEVRLGAAAGPSGAAVATIAEGSRVRISGRIEPGRRIVALRVDLGRGRGTDDRSSRSGRGRGADDASDDGRSGSGDNRGGDTRRGDDGGGSGKGSGDRGSGGRRGGEADRGSSSGERGSRAERVDKAEKVEKAEKAERAERVDKGAKVEKAVDKVEKAVRPESGRSGRD